MSADFAALTAQCAVLDGAWSSGLWSLGWSRSAPAEVASVEQPELVARLASEYLSAGAEVFTTNTFAANRFRLERLGLTTELVALNRDSVQVSRSAISDRPLLGTIGPSGLVMAVQEISDQELVAGVGRQVDALLESGVDGILFETFSELKELLLSVSAARDAGAPFVIASMSFDSGPQRTQTLAGAQASDVAAALEDAGVQAVGANCGAGAEAALPSVVALRASTKLPVQARPSVGLPDLSSEGPTYSQTPQQFVEQMKPIVEAGVNLVGGCCGAGPEHVAKLATMVKRQRR